MKARFIPAYHYVHQGKTRPKGKYLLREDGTVYRWDEQSAEWKVCRTHDDPPRVILYAHGERRRVYIHKLMRECFPELT